MLRILKTFLLLLVVSLSFAQVPKTWQPQPFWYQMRGLYADSTLRAPAFNMWYVPYTNKDSTGQMWYWTSQNSFAGKWGTVTRLFASQDWVQQRVIDSMPTLQRVMLKGNTTSSDLLFGGVSGGPRLQWTQFSDYGRIQFTSTADDNNSSNLVFTIGDNVDASSVDRFIFQKDIGATGGATPMYDTIVEMSSTNGIQSRRAITSTQNIIAQGNISASGTLTSNTSISTPGNIQGSLFTSSNGVSIIKDGSASAALTVLRLFNAAQTRGFNIQLSGNNTSGVSMYTLNGATWTRRLDIDSVGQVGIASSTPNSTLTVNGTMSNPNITVYSGNVTLSNDYYVNINNTTNVVVTLPNPAAIVGRHYVITKVSNNSFTVNITPSSGQIVFSSTYVMTGAGSSVTVWTDGTNWWIK